MYNELSVMNSYIKDIARIPLLTAEEEKELAVKAASGDKNAKTRLINANLRFVINIAKQFAHRGMELEDLVSEGNIGLIIAIDHFDVNKGFRFISYAVWWIRQTILKALSEKTRPIRLPMNKADDLVRIEKARKMLGSKLSEEEEFTEVARMLNLESSYVKEMVEISREMLSLDAEINADGAVKSFGETVEDCRYTAPEEAAVDSCMKEDISKVLSSLKPNEERVLRLRYGLNGVKPMSLKEVGKQFNLTRERIRQIEQSAIKHMRVPGKMSKLSAYVA
ncbi:RNA polymerase sigma factor RpoD/SigA [Treponema sp.]|uniref:sigma-70 family RNA polymerase sigma factor n=1 Tax=Treponema sp. TaxID=166 RepID=UPI0025CD8417|nr:RNA polymerase sigma factor RpoD/SigA [Treponema sp.]MCR5218571.1 RNA polymerase sigma factor RpoD/SigA [Treponema sp.]